MLRILIVEDELLIGKGIQAKLRQTDLPITSIDFASSAEQAYELLQQKEFDVVLTDIKMGPMSGIDLIEKVRKTNDHTEFIILSGFAEFSYAQQAMRLGVDQYLLKPVTKEKLRDAVLQADLRRREKSEALKPAQVLLQMMLTAQPGLEAYRQSHHLFPGDKLFLVVSACELGPDALNQLIWGLKKMPFKVEYLSDAPQKGEVNFLIAGKSLQILEAATGALRGLQKQGVSFRAGISACGPAPQTVLYRQAARALSLRLQDRENTLFSAQSILPNPLRGDQSTRLQILLQHRDLSAIRAMILELLHAGQGCAADIYLEVLHTAFLSFTRQDEILDKARWLSELSRISFSDMASSDQLVAGIMELIGEVYSQNNRYPHSGKEDLARMIRDYLKAHFTEDVTLSAISEQFSLSPPYIVTLFKKQYGTTVVEYLTDLRIEYACEALKNSAVAAAEIGSAVGYHDAAYFYRVFKKKTGLTPSQYRAKYGTVGE